MDADKLNSLESAFRCKYDTELSGSNLMQFHPDFSLKCGHSSDIESIFLGPKADIDQLVCLQCGETGEHYRMKGVPDHSIVAKAEEFGSIYALYKELCVNPVTFCLNPEEKVKFNVTINRVNTLDDYSFVQTLEF